MTRTARTRSLDSGGTVRVAGFPDTWAGGLAGAGRERA
jgi:hypothetical protein